MSRTIGSVAEDSPPPSPSSTVVSGNSTLKGASEPTSRDGSKLTEEVGEAKSHKKGARFWLVLLALVMCLFLALLEGVSLTPVLVILDLNATLDLVCCGDHSPGDRGRPQCWAVYLDRCILRSCKYSTVTLQRRICRGV